MDPTTERKIDPTVALAQQGDQDAFASLYAKYVKFAQSVVRRIVPYYEVEDITQDVFLHVSKKIGKFDGRSQFKTWLYRLATNVALMSRRRKRTVEIASGPAPDGWNLDLFPIRKNTDPELHIDLIQQISALTPNRRRAVIEHAVFGYAHTEIRGLRDRTHKTRYHKAALEIREALCSS